MSVCRGNVSNAGPGGIERMYSEGTMISRHFLGSLGVLHFDEYRDNSEAIRRLLFGEPGPAGSPHQHVALHALVSDDREVLCAILSLAESGHN